MVETVNSAVLEEPQQIPFNRSAANLEHVRSFKTKPNKSSALSQAITQQRIAHKVVCGLEQDMDSAQSAAERKSVAIAIRMAIAAYSLACEAVRIARNRPLPGSLRPVAPPPRKSKRNQETFVEPVAPAPVAPKNPTAQT
jgi:hypothetical protein